MDFDRDALLEVFRAESEEGLAVMETSLVALEQQAGEAAAEALAEVFRAAHTLKGSARSLGFDDLADFAHGAEDLLASMRSGELAASPARVTALLQACDALRSLLADALAGGQGLRPEQAALLQRLRATALPADPAPPPAAPPSRPASGEGRAPADPGTPGGDAATLRVGVEKLDRLLDLAGEIAVAQSRVRQTVEGLTQGGEALDALLTIERLQLDLQERVMQARMVPVAPVFRSHVRTVRDVAAERGKQARLVSEGADVEADTRVVQYLRDPLAHMVRNAVDHGLEPPAARRACGKDPCGTVKLRAFHERSELVVEVADDGAGLDPARLLAQARRRGLVGPAESPPEPELLRLIFTPGFSTAEEVTGLSGRGVGLDVVRRNVEALRGSVGVASRRGEGTTFTIRLPLTLLVARGFLVTVADEAYVVPMEAVVECSDLPPQACSDTGVGGVVSLRGECLPYLRLARFFGLGARTAPEREAVVLVQHQGRRAGLAVDGLLGEIQAVVRPLGRLLRDVPGLSGATILGNGRVGLMLDVAALLRAGARGSGSGTVTQEDTR